MIGREPVFEEFSKVETYCSNIDNAKDFGEVWEIVKDTVQESLGAKRGGMSLYLDNLPVQLGAYHPLGTNNIVLNRTLVDIIKTTTKSREVINAFIYNLLLHEYLHAIGYVRETEVRTLVYGVSMKCFGENHIVTKLAKEGPWTLLKGVPMIRNVRHYARKKSAVEIVKDFEKSDKGYIV